MAVPKIIPYDVELRSVNPVRSFDRPKAYTNDLKSVEFQFKILDMTSIELNTATAITLVYMRDGSFFQNPKEDVDLVGTTFSYTLKENEGNHAGVAKIQLIVTIGEAEYATQLYEFEIINGLETKVAQEVMIYDWTTLTRDARAYIDQFVADELLRDAEFDNNEFDRNAAFNQAQTNRTTAYGIAEAARDADYEENEALRQAGYDADHSRADTDHTRADDDHDLAGTDHTTAENDHTIADTDHTRAETDHTRADADSVTVAGFNTRLTAEETATANNKISAVKGKTFADVDARFEDVEFDTTLMGTNLVTNGDFSNGTTGWGYNGATLGAVNGEAALLASTQYGGLNRSISLIDNNLYYVRAKIKSTSKSVFLTLQKQLGYDTLKVYHGGSGNYENLSTIGNIGVTSSPQVRVIDSRASGWDTVYIDDILVIDLTTAFGKGNEPTAEQMDALLAKFPNSWFDGTKNLFRANAALNKLMAVDARTEFEAKNEVANGDFSNGTTGWAAAGSTIAVANNELAVTQSVDWNSRAITTPAFVTSGTNMFYIAANVKATVNTVGINLDSYAVGLKYHSGSGAYERLSAVVTNSNPSHNLYLVDKGTLAVPARTSHVKNAIVINLTAAFGAGKEPTLAEMDRLMARFPNSWFDGVKPIQTIETLYLEKANKVQEAWITPTLLNGAVPVASKPPQYYKDEFGAVVVQGLVTVTSLNSDIFILPIGYRPTKSKVLPTTANNNSFASVLVKTTGEVQLLSGTLASVSVDCIRFKAEQ